MENDVTALIDRFLRGEMSIDEETKFKKEIQGDPALKQQVKEHLLLVRGIHHVMKEQDDKIINSIYATNKKISPKWQWLKISSIAAAIALLVVVGHDILYIHSTHDYADYLSQSSSYNPEFIVSRGSCDDILAIKLFSLFADVASKENLDTTIIELSELYAQSRDEYVDYIDDFTTQIGIQLAIAYIYNNEYKAAKDVLECVVEDNPNAKDAQILLQKIKSILFAKI